MVKFSTKKLLYLSAACLAVSQWNEERPASNNLSNSDLRFFEDGDTAEGWGLFLLFFLRCFLDSVKKKNTIRLIPII